MTDIVIDQKESTKEYVSHQHTTPPTGTESALVSPNSYYRSKVLNINHGINPLATAASPIFSIIHQTRQLHANSNFEQLHCELVHEIQAFECQTQQHAYQEKAILAARFALCSFIDERIERQLGQDKKNWEPFLMLNRFHGLKSGDDRFYIILERSSADIEGHIDLLELFYICLTLGYQGKFESIDHGYIIRENLVNRLYEKIRKQRGEFTKNVLVANENATPLTTPVKKASKGVLAISLASILIMLGIVITEYYSVQETNNTIEKTMKNLVQPQPQVR